MTRRHTYSILSIARRHPLMFARLNAVYSNARKV